MELMRTRQNQQGWYDVQAHPAMMLNSCAMQYQTGIPSPTGTYTLQPAFAGNTVQIAAMPAGATALYGVPNIYPTVSYADLISIAQQASAPVLPPPAEDSSEINADMTLSLHMEKVWHGVFSKLFGAFLPHMWHLLPTQNPVDEPGWKIFQDSAKVRFICSDCGRAWTSMKGRCIFWFKLEASTGVGIVLFKLFGQRCQHCNHPDRFDHAMWYPHEVVKVVQNIYQKVGETYYRFPHLQIRMDRRPGKPRQRHNKDLCQACREGICKDNDDSLKELRTLTPPSSDNGIMSSGNSSGSD